MCGKASDRWEHSVSVEATITRSQAPRTKAGRHGTIYAPTIRPHVPLSLFLSLSLSLPLRIFPMVVWEVSPPHCSCLWWISGEVSDFPGWPHPIRLQHKRCRACRESQYSFFFSSPHTMWALNIERDQKLGHNVESESDHLSPSSS